MDLGLGDRAGDFGGWHPPTCPVWIESSGFGGRQFQTPVFKGGTPGSEVRGCRI